MGIGIDGGLVDDTGMVEGDVWELTESKIEGGGRSGGRPAEAWPLSMAAQRM